MTGKTGNAAKAAKAAKTGKAFAKAKTKTGRYITKCNHLTFYEVRVYDDEVQVQVYIHIHKYMHTLINTYNIL